MRDDVTSGYGKGGPTSAAQHTGNGRDVMWGAFKEHSGCTRDTYVVASFGDSAQMADELGACPQGAKAGDGIALRDYSGPGADLFPAVGDYALWLDGAGVPRCITRTTMVEVKALCEVDDQFAWDEGEGDRSRPWWLSAHRRYFVRCAEREGFAIDDTIATVFERFEVVWPN